MAKVSIIGAGHVGATLASNLLSEELSEIVLLDIAEGLAKGKALDLLQSTAISKRSVDIIGTQSYDDLKDSDIVVITAGLPRKPGMSREDLLLKNGQIIKEVVSKIKKIVPETILILVTNPLDIMCQLALKVSDFPKERVFGMAGALDAGRLKAFISLELNCSVKDIETLVLGGHGDSMVPLKDYTTVSGIPINNLLPTEKIETLFERTRKGGGEIVSLLKTGSAYYAPAAGAFEMVTAVLRDEKRIIPSAVYLTGEYQLKDVYVGVPVKIGKLGIEEIIELKLDSEALSSLHKSAKIVSDNFKKLSEKI